MRMVRRDVHEAVTPTTEKDVFLKIFHDLTEKGRHVHPRGQKVLEIENYSYVLPPYARFMNFEARGLKLDYVKSEVLWYLRGDPSDTSILEKAKMWQNLVNDDGTINSNYGQYIFWEQNQFDRVVETLLNDRDSRRGSIVILNHEHLSMQTYDVPCTYAINFRIRGDELKMSVHMRSQDAIFGMGNDAPAFSIVQEMMLHALRPSYPGLVMGEYNHTVDSFHVYERHFPMLAQMLADPSFVQVDCPRILDGDEVEFLRSTRYDDVPVDYNFTRWLLNLQ
jgi:thymidylate synthase